MSATESAPEPQSGPQPGNLARVISANVKTLMTQRGVSQQQLAAAVGMPQTSISKRLRGDAKWTADDIEVVALAFEVEPTELLRPMAEVTSRPLRSVARDLPHRRMASGERREPRVQVTERYAAWGRARLPLTGESVRDEWRIREVPGSHVRPVLLRRHAGNHSRCQRVAA